MIIFIYGEDTFRSREKLNALKARFKREVDQSGVSTSEIDGKDLKLETLSSATQSGGFLATKRMVVIGRFLTGGQKDLVSRVTDYIPEMSKSENVIIFWDQKVDKRSGLYKKLSKEKYSYEFELLKPNELQRWIVTRVQQERGQITGDGASLLAAEVGTNLWQLAGEISKLIAYKKEGEVINQDDVRELVVGNYEENIFALTDAVAHRDSKRALQLIDHELKGGMNAIYLYTMLARQFRILLQVKAILADKGGRVSHQVVAKELGLHPFVVKKSLPQAERFTFSELKRLYSRLLGIDEKLKSTKVPAGVLFDLLVMGNK